MTDQAVNTVWSADYLPFGLAGVTLSTVENNLRFAGQYYDSETGLHYNYYRYYDPKLGRYLRADPIFEEDVFGLQFIKTVLNKPANFNHYAYAIQNPLKYLDSTGLSCGPGWLGDILIRDYHFESCCDKHDNCYDNKGPDCGKTKQVCDREFCDCMLTTCENVSDKGKCRRKARSWCRKVKNWGYGFYHQRCKTDCQMPDPPTTK